MLEGEQAVKEGMIDEVGGIKEAFAKLHSYLCDGLGNTGLFSND